MKIVCEPAAPDRDTENSSGPRTHPRIWIQPRHSRNQPAGGSICSPRAACSIGTSDQGHPETALYRGNKSIHQECLQTVLRLVPDHHQQCRGPGDPYQGGSGQVCGSPSGTCVVTRRCRTHVITRYDVAVIVSLYVSLRTSAPVIST